LLLKNHGILREGTGRGLRVASLEVNFVRDLYELRGALDRLATGLAAERGSTHAKEEGAGFIERGRAAVDKGSIAEMIAADMDFHFFIYGLSENPLISERGQTQWNYLRRVMGQVLLKGETPGDIWDQHEKILEAIIAGDVENAKRLAEHHIVEASGTLATRLGK
jgi:DNA-binding GntR family transcriptional regulator